MYCFLSLLVFLTLSAAHIYGCRPCSCSTGTTGTWKDLKLAWCYQGLTEVPDTKILPADIEILDIRNIPITSLKADQFKYFNNLKIIYVADSKLKDIQKHAFRNMIYVTEIALHNNSISKLATDLFTDTPNLASLWLSHNQLTVLQTNLFANLKSLKTINLKRNLITTIEHNCFVNVPSLTKLFLNNNYLKSLQLNPTIINSLELLILNDNPWHCDTTLCEIMNATVSRKMWGVNPTPTCTTPKNQQGKQWNDVQQDMCQADRFSMSCSPCSCVDNFTVAECTAPLQLTRVPVTLPQHVTILRVTDQKFTILEENQFAYLKQLQEIYLERNKINDINPKTFKNQEKLTMLSLTDNNITQLHKDTFSFTPKLTKLWLNKNNISVLYRYQFSYLSSLEELDISHNKINFIDDDCFINVSSLQTVNLSFNNLQNLKLSIIDDLSSLKNLYLNGNPWQCDDSLCEIMNAAVSGRIWTGDNDPTCATPHKLKGMRWHQIYDHFQPRISSNVSSVEEGHDITLQCKYCFVSNVMWTFNGIKLSRNVQQVSDTSLLSTLTVKNARKEEQGYYVCHVDDCRRCEDAWLHVKVNEKRHQDAVNMKEVFHITANSSYNYTRRGIILLSYTILEDEGLENEDSKNHKEL